MTEPPAWRACEDGIGTGCARLAWGSAGNAGESRALSERACLAERQPSAHACLDAIGVSGTLDPEPLPPARRPYARRGCALGLLRACSILAHSLTHGEESDPEIGAALQQAACAANFLPACLRLGELQETGRGMPRDLDAAALTHERLCREGGALGTPGCVPYARVLLVAARSPDEVIAARKKVEPMCAQDLSGACALLGRSLLEQIPRDTRLGGTVLVEACTKTRLDAADCARGVSALLDVGRPYVGKTTAAIESLCARGDARCATLRARARALAGQ